VKVKLEAGLHSNVILTRKINIKKPLFIQKKQKKKKVNWGEYNQKGCRDE